METIVQRIKAIANGQNFDIERLPSTHHQQANGAVNGLNIPVEKFDFIGLIENRWLGTMIVYPDGTFVIENGGRYNWSERFNNLNQFKKYLKKKVQVA